MLNPVQKSINQKMTNGLSNPYQMGEPIFIDIKSNFSFLFHFSMKFMKATEQPQMGRRVSRRHNLGYLVCLCLIKRTSGLYGLKKVMVIFLIPNFFGCTAWFVIWPEMSHVA